MAIQPELKWLIVLGISLKKQLLLLVLLQLCFTTAYAASPQVLGYGVKPCEAYLQAHEGWDAGLEEQIEQYLHYRDWLTGFVSGLSLALGKDALHGVEISGAMRRIQLYCDEQPTDDFFTASMSLIKLLSKLEQGGAE